jgi:hypothetical protein
VREVNIGEKPRVARCHFGLLLALLGAGEEEFQFQDFEMRSQNPVKACLVFSSRGVSLGGF